MGFEEKAKEKATFYADNWDKITGLDSNSHTLYEISRIDFLNGYNQGLKDLKEAEELEVRRREYEKTLNERGKNQRIYKTTTAKKKFILAIIWAVFLIVLGVVSVVLYDQKQRINDLENYVYPVIFIDTNK